MCGRASLTTPDWETIRALVEAEPDPEQAAAWRPRYNIAPSQPHPILRVVDGTRRLTPADWGIQAHQRLAINARAETLGSRPLWQAAVAERRCLVPVDGFYEWHDRQPYWYHRSDGQPFVLAGVWEGAPARPRFAVITVRANAMVAPVHDRMPALLPPACIAEWLANPAVGLLVPAPEDALVATPVSTRVNSTTADDPSLIVPVRPKTQLSLF